MGRQLLRHALANPTKHRRAARQDHIRVQVLADVDIALHDGLEGSVMDAASLLTDEARLVQHLRATEPLTAHSNDVAIRELVSLLLIRALSSCLHLGVEVQGDVTQLFLDITHDLTLCSGGEGVSALSED